MLVFMKSQYPFFDINFTDKIKNIHAVYLFIAGSCYLEKWRMIKSDVIQYASEKEKTKQLAQFSEKAVHYLQLAPTYVPGYGGNASEKGGIGGSNKQMPFDKFVLRKNQPDSQAS